ncbi:hypothetical protein RI129_009772 [Pyrocoelia pectoralis]|uniref:Uncharacterized protein n=1 Tax=Pyrocoelia pectoralis TaxID=417401 RepID=A0AAN7ZCJ9_9COLE
MVYMTVRKFFNLTPLNILFGTYFKMSAMPQGAFMAKKWTENQKRIPKEEISFWDGNMELKPLHYNSKLMNSIWGLYNRYSVHNLKDNRDKALHVGAINQQIQSVGCASSGTNLALIPWDHILGYQ